MESWLISGRKKRAMRPAKMAMELATQNGRWPLTILNSVVFGPALFLMAGVQYDPIYAPILPIAAAMP